MRSRYSAYALKLPLYLLATWHTDTRPAILDLNDEPALKWIGLQIKGSQQISAECAQVEFVARYKENGKAKRLHETSTFVKVNDAWYYLNGVHE